MAVGFPNLASGTPVKYPVSRSKVYRTVVLVASDGTEQRFSKGLPLASFTLTYKDIKTTDKEILRAFWNARKGAYDVGWYIDFPEPSRSSPTRYENMQFVPGSQFVAVETHFDRWDVTLEVRQTRP